MKLPGSMRALAHRNFRYYFAGQAISIFGTWVQQVAMSWLVYRLTGSAALLGITAFAALVPQLVVAPLAGAWADRHDKRRMLVIVESLLAVQAIVLAALTWLEWVGPMLLVALAGVLGILNAFEGPLRQSLISRMVPERADLPNALALNAMLFNAGRFVGPPVAGLMLTVMSEAACFTVNAATFLALIASLRFMDIEAPPKSKGSTAHVFRQGLAYAWDTYPIRILILTLIVSNLTASSYAVLLPIFAKEVFAGDARTLGLLWGAAGCGAFFSTVFLATRKSADKTVIAVTAGVVLSAAALLVFPLTARLEIALPAMVALGFGISVTNVGSNMTLQTVAPEHMRGRVVSFFGSARFGFDALGGLIAGFIAARFGAPNTLLFEGAVLLIGAGWLATHRRRLRAEAVQRN
jgi:MFS family permease